MPLSQNESLCETIVQKVRFIQSPPQTHLPSHLPQKSFTFSLDRGLVTLYVHTILSGPNC